MADIMIIDKSYMQVADCQLVCKVDQTCIKSCVNHLYRLKMVISRFIQIKMSLYINRNQIYRFLNTMEVIKQMFTKFLMCLEMAMA